MWQKQNDILLITTLSSTTQHLAKNKGDSSFPFIICAYISIHLTFKWKTQPFFYKSTTVYHSLQKNKKNRCLIVTQDSKCSWYILVKYAHSSKSIFSEMTVFFLLTEKNKKNLRFWLSLFFSEFKKIKGQNFVLLF